jgi:DNA (cytosine-5-)-methyltransferase
MNIVIMPVTDLHPADYNPRKDLKPGDKEYDKLARSIEEFGYVEPIVWNRTTGNIIGGHQRLKVLIEKGYTEVEVVGLKLSEQEEKILNVALNKISGRWDNEKLIAVLDELQAQEEMELTGFDDWELEALKVTYDHIEDLLQDDFADTGKNESENFTMTFTLPAEVKEAMDRYIEENPAGKTELASLIANKAKGVI